MSPDRWTRDLLVAVSTPRAASPQKPDTAQTDPKPHGRGLGSWAVWLALPIACAVVSYAFYYAARHDNSYHFAIFWAGMLVFMIPATLRLLAEGTARIERLQITAAWGLLAYAPKFLRDPHGPLWYDELAHSLQVDSIHQQKALFQPNPLIPEIEHFPGLHLATDALRELTGLSTFATGTTLIAILHISALVGVFFIAERLWSSSRAGGVAAIIYALNPGFMIFDTQFAYESLGIVFFIWAVAVLVAIQTSTDGYTAWLIIGLFVLAACAATHHLSSYAAAAVLLLAAASLMLRRTTRAQRIATVSLAGLALISDGAWFFAGGSSAVDYLWPHIGGGLSQTLALVSNRHGGRQLFERSMLPEYERAAAFVAPVVTALGVGAGLLSLRIRRRAPPALLAVAALGILYFPALPFFLTRAGNEGARRSLDFSYLGIAVLVAPVAIASATGWRRHVAASRGTSWQAAARRTALIANCAMVFAALALLLGNVASGFNAAYRFPGPYIYGSDTRSQTAELFSAVDWFRDTQGVDRRMIVDRYNGMIFAARGREWPVEPSPGFPAWNLYFKTPAPVALLRQLSASGDGYLVVDERMARELPLIGVYFSGAEPLAQQRTRPLPIAAIDKFREADWARNIYASNNLTIYRLRFAKSDLLPFRAS